MKEKRRFKLSAINGLRGIAILAVLYQHVLCDSLSNLLSRVRFLNLSADTFLFKHGWMGVNLFFILSGFVLFLPYYLQEREMCHKADFMQFYNRRFGRLMPLFLFNCLVCAAAAMRYQPFWYESFWRTVTTASMYSDVQWFPTINPALWSLMLEIYFSLLCPFLIVAWRRPGWKMLAFTVFAVAWIFRLVGAWTGHVCVFDSLPARLDDFLVGMLLCKVYFENRFVHIPVELALLGALLFLSGGTVLCELHMHAHAMPLPLVPFINNVLQLGFFFLCLAALRAQAFLRRIITCYPLQLLGMMCYSLYIWHLLALEPLTAGWQSHPVHLVQYAAFLLGISILSYRYIEFGYERDWKKLFAIPLDERQATFYGTELASQASGKENRQATAASQ